MFDGSRADHFRLMHLPNVNDTNAFLREVFHIGRMSNGLRKLNGRTMCHSVEFARINVMKTLDGPRFHAQRKLDLRDFI